MIYLVFILHSSDLNSHCVCVSYTRIPIHIYQMDQMLFTLLLLTEIRTKLPKVKYRFTHTQNVLQVFRYIRQRYRIFCIRICIKLAVAIWHGKECCGVFCYANIVCAYVHTHILLKLCNLAPRRSLHYFTSPDHRESGKTLWTKTQMLRHVKQMSFWTWHR